MKTIIHAPQGRGKTRNAAALANFFGCTAIIDDWNGCTPLSDWSLALTNTSTLSVEHLENVRVLSLDEAMRQMSVTAAIPPAV